MLVGGKKKKKKKKEKDEDAFVVCRLKRFS